jgi:hypothetical protein
MAANPEFFQLCSRLEGLRGHVVRHLFYEHGDHRIAIYRGHFNILLGHRQWLCENSIPL